MICVGIVHLLPSLSLPWPCVPLWTVAHASVLVGGVRRCQGLEGELHGHTGLLSQCSELIQVWYCPPFWMPGVSVGKTETAGSRQHFRNCPGDILHGRERQGGRNRNCVRNHPFDCALSLESLLSALLVLRTGSSRGWDRSRTHS